MVGVAERSPGPEPSVGCGSPGRWPPGRPARSARWHSPFGPMVDWARVPDPQVRPHREDTMTSVRTRRLTGSAPKRRAQQQPGRRFTRSGAGSGLSRLPRRRQQPQPGGAEKLMQLVRGALPGSGGKRGRGNRSRKPAGLGALGAAGAAGAALAARRHSRSASPHAGGTQSAPEPPTGSAPATPADDDPGEGSG